MVPLPDHPPFTARFLNLDYGTTEESFAHLFDNTFKILEIKLPLDMETNRSRGFAFVEFDDRSSLEKATQLDGHTFMGRNMRVLVAEARQQRGGFQRRDQVPDDGKDRDFDNWDRRGPLPALNDNRHDNHFNNRDNDRNYEGGFRSSGRPAPEDDNRNYDGGFRSSGRPAPVDDNRNYEGGFRSSGRPAPEEDNRNYEGGFRSARSPAAPVPEDNRDYDHWEHRGPISSVEDRQSKFGNRGGRQGGHFNHDNSQVHEKSEEEKKIDSVDNWRTSDAPRSPARSNNTPFKPAGRRKLNLLPRSKPLDSAPEIARSSSLFGTAKPVDTAKKLLEIEEKQDKLHQERVEREQKKAARAKEAKEAREAKEAKEKLEATTKSLASLSTEDGEPAQKPEEVAPLKVEPTSAEKVVVDSAPQAEVVADGWNVVPPKRAGRK